MGLTTDGMSLDVETKILADKMAKYVYNPEYYEKMTDREKTVVGLAHMIARGLDWANLNDFLEVTYRALEDSNFHTPNQIIEAMQDSVKLKILVDFMPLLGLLSAINNLSDKNLHLEFFENWTTEVAHSDF